MINEAAIFQTILRIRREEDEEVWKVIPGIIPSFNGRYEASTHGRVRVLRILKPSLDKLMTRAWISKIGSLHSLIARTFIGPRPKGLVINHKDGNPTGNNRPENLEYVTDLENIRHAWMTGLATRDYKLTVSRRKRLIMDHLSGEFSCNALSEKYGVHRVTVRQVLREAEKYGLPIPQPRNFKKKTAAYWFALYDRWQAGEDKQALKRETGLQQGSIDNAFRRIQNGDWRRPSDSPTC